MPEAGPGPPNARPGGDGRRGPFPSAPGPDAGHGQQPPTGPSQPWAASVRPPTPDEQQTTSAELPPRPRQGGRRRRARERSFPRALLLTVLGAVMPGSGLLVARRRVLGGVVIAIAAILLLVAIWAATLGQREALHLAVAPEALVAAGAVLAAIGVGWVFVIVVTHRLLRPRDATVGQRVLGSTVVGLLALIVLIPMVVGSRYAFVQHDLVTNVFAAGDSRSETRPDDATKQDPWAGQQRVNVLLLGGDADEGREGVRPDTTIVASIDTDTGQTTLFSLPRNLMRVPFPDDSRLSEVYPDGVFTGYGDEAEWMLNAIYRNVPAEHPDILDSDHPGADATKLAVGEALGLRLDYFVLVNLDGFEELIDAFGGVTINVNSRVPIGGSDETGQPPDGWIEPGPDKHLDGPRALWFARGRYGSSDYDRMGRQRCMMNAIIDQANPGRVLQRYERIANSSKNMVETDIPGNLLPAFVDLSVEVKDADINSIVFDDTVITPADPDYDLIQDKVDAALTEAEQEADDANGGSNNQSSDNEPSDNDQEPPQNSSGDQDNDDGDGAGGAGQASDSLQDRCAYRPQQEQ